MNNTSMFDNMEHDQVLDIIKEGLHYLTTIDLVTLHSEISKVQINSSHLREDPIEK
jgi:hypothetical protein